MSNQEDFVQALTTSQGRLQAYLFCLLGDFHDANTVLQETNLVLWKKAEELMDLSRFNAWSREVAYFQALAFLRDRKREKLIFSQEAIERIAVERDAIDYDERRLALRSCVSQMQGNKRIMIKKRYVQNKRISQIAKDLQRTDGAIKMALKRIRVALMDCITRRMEAMS